ncbi:hypothetical protein N7495_002385 [Penicillium taxi]|uniref:uncharacterized protein n=1 Tax=Penicillium taxi TaxID=168475 RepID=UPI0025458CDA|nr:uncharacterized protein N7495_002385 [Penicillium taxi]KAJ5901857.1 hypothetical protein N7495_002385 [Penicillium taxi]
MDLQGTPIPPGPRSTKVTTDPLAYEQPRREPAGPITNDSLAAESIKNGGAFSKNRGAEPLGVSGSNSTLNTTDISAATTLPSAPTGGLRENRLQQEKYPEALDGQGDFPGTHLSQSGYVGGSTSAKQQMGMHAGQSQASGSSQYNNNQAPSYTDEDTGDHQNQKSQSNFSSDASKNVSFNSEIGSDQDPGRAAVHKFQRTNAESGPDVGPRQKEIDNQTRYQPLEVDQRI